MQIIEILIQIAIFLLAISIHESSHAYSAYKLGDPTGKYAGRISLNPIRHIDPIGTVLLPLIGVLARIPIVGWAKPCPVNPYYFRNPKKDNMIVAAAGPISNLITAAVFGFAYRILSQLFSYESIVFHKTMAIIGLVLLQAVLINIILALFNLIPIAPLDGGWILEGLLPAHLEQQYYAFKPYGFIIILVLFYFGIIWAILKPIAGLLFFIMVGAKL